MMLMLAQGIFKRILLVRQIYGVELCPELELEDGGWRPEVRGRRTKPWVGFLGRRQLGGLGNAVSFRSGVWGEAPAAVDFEGFGTSQNAS